MIVLLATAFAWSPTPSEEAMVRALSSRDGAPPCAELEAMVPEPVHSLQRVVENVSMPPWAPMFAAACLIEGHAQETPELLRSWVKGERTRGLAKLVFNRLHMLEQPQARDLLDEARSGPWTKELERALLRPANATLRSE